MTIYFLPTSPRAHNDNVFEPSLDLRHEGGNFGMDYWARLRETLGRKGVAIHTYDLWRKESAKPDDVLLVQNHPGETWPWRLFYFLKSRLWGEASFFLERRRYFLKNYKYFSRRILIQTETPIVMPYVYRDLPRLKRRGIYHKFFLVAREPEGYDFINYFLTSSVDITGSYFRAPKTKFLVLINSNGIPHSFSLRRELFGERLRAIKYFSGVHGFDLFGHGWDKPPRHPLFRHYKKYVAKAWRGAVENKMKTISQYKFMICYENSAYRGYVSEKIFDCLAAGVVPVYLGAPDIETIVPKSCLIDKRDFPTYEALHEYLRTMSDERLEEYRRSMLEFMQNHPKNGMEKFIDRLLA